MEAVPIAVFWILVAWVSLRHRQALLPLFFASLPFGSLAVIPTSLTAGLTLTPAPIVALLVIARQLGRKGGLARAVDAALTPSVALLLLAFWIVASVTTLFMPRFFAGEVVVIAVSQADFALLRPTLQNVSQFVYISISVLATFAFADLLTEPGSRERALNALCLGAAITALTGVLDFCARYVPLEPLLDLFRTATYALLTNDEILDSKRVVGLMPEASSFGTLALSFLSLLYFFRRAMAAGFVRQWLVPALMASLLALIALSTSSAAYLGLGVLGGAMVAEWCWRSVAAGRNPYLRHGLARELRLSLAALALLVLLFVAVPRLFAPMQQMFDTMVLQKTSSLSYEERTMWTQVSWRALWETHGLGVGLGGTRASNFAVALASNVGIVGALLYALFVAQCLFLRRGGRDDAQGGALMSAVRWAYFAPFLAGLTIGTTPDFGVLNAWLYGFSIALLQQPTPRRAFPVAAVRAGSGSIARAPRAVIGDGARLG
ncbi:hypothetical protein NF681_19315 (plasmid) [Comamonadaceae bacterium OTU4NAUVB1]|nr:hypothetical protein NF681_19315 [Comamonadaceae bacterium OTU4NAUVB1]